MDIVYTLVILRMLNLPDYKTNYSGDKKMFQDKENGTPMLEIGIAQIRINISTKIGVGRRAGFDHVLDWSTEES